MKAPGVSKHLQPVSPHVTGHASFTPDLAQRTAVLFFPTNLQCFFFVDVYWNFSWTSWQRLEDVGVATGFATGFATGLGTGLPVGLDVTGLRVGFAVTGVRVGLDVTGLRVGLDVTGLRVGLDVTGLRVGLDPPDCPPPHTQQASFAVCPKFSKSFPISAHLLSTSPYHSQVYVSPS